jgi:hypothetical protein
MLEYSVHLDVADSPGDLFLATAEIPDELEREQIEAGDLPPIGARTPRSRKVRRRFCEAGRVLPIAGALGAGGHRKGLPD